MILHECALTQWRNYEKQSLSFHPTLNIFLGPNGQGKTNLLEAIYYLCYGKNFRANRDRELMQWEKAYFRLEGFFSLDASSRRQHIELYYDNVHKKRIRLNGVSYGSMAKLPARPAAILFTPDDLTVVKGAPGERRRFIDRELADLYLDYEKLRLSYERVLSQRSELLREVRAKRADKTNLVVWNLQLVNFGVAMIRRRLSLLALLVPQARRVHAYIAPGGGHFDVTYQSSLGNVLQMGDEEMKTRFLELLSEKEGEEIARAQNLLGPHRDDLVFYLNGNDLRTYGSQGQQRTAVLAMKMAAIDIYGHVLGQRPLLLLDDVMSELDYTRQQKVMEIVTKKEIQTFITGTGLDFSFKGFGFDPVFRIKNGAVEG